jgi:alkylation response protein AidB-like acyl-CoA dehydrogenase
MPVFAGALFDRARHALPALSDTEREALAAGDVWWDAALFGGNPDWNELLSHTAPTLSTEERAFIDGPVQALCALVDDWQVNQRGDLPPEAWAFLRQHKFFGMIIPKQYGGLGFSAYAHSEVVQRVSTRSITAGVTVMVPNSLGPGELLLRFGTPAQKSHYLPRLADGREIPCFALTSEQAGSDAAAMRDRGVVCEGVHEGQRVLGLRVSWSKRYITLAPVATLLGLAFKAHDPHHLLGERDELGITLALIPTGTRGVNIGRRHWPAMQAFQNGPTSGTDVFVPLDWVIGGRRTCRPPTTRCVKRSASMTSRRKRCSSARRRVPQRQGVRGARCAGAHPEADGGRDHPLGGGIPGGSCTGTGFSGGVGTSISGGGTTSGPGDGGSISGKTSGPGRDGAGAGAGVGECIDACPDRPPLRRNSRMNTSMPSDGKDCARPRRRTACRLQEEAEAQRESGHAAQGEGTDRRHHRRHRWTDRARQRHLLR